MIFKIAPERVATLPCEIYSQL